MLHCGRVTVCEPRTLYAGLLGSAWLDLAEPIRAAHGPGATLRARGRLRIAHGRSHAARWLARLMRLPRASEAAETHLVVTRHAGGEHWSRTFGDRRLDTRQYVAASGDLAERFGLLEFRFRLAASEGSLLIRQVEAALMCGPVRVGIPSAWAPSVDAREDPAGPRRIRVHVRVALPAVGPLMTYDGAVDFEDTPA
jgi:hypothetical protein